MGKGGGGRIFNYSPFGVPLHFDWTKLAYAQLRYGGIQYKTVIGSIWYLATEEMR